jgi:anti-sigma-K factor RskA
MDIQSYIKSGRVEHYVLGLATPEDAKEIERFAAEFPEFQDEINRVQDTLGKLATSAAINPPAGLKEKIMSEIDRIATGQPEKPRAKPAETPRKPDQNRPDATNNGSNRGNSGGSGFPFGWLLAGLMTLGAGWLFKMNNDMRTVTATEKTRADEAVAKFDALEKDCTAAQKRTELINKQIAFARDPATRSVAMKGLDKSPASSATVLYNNNTKETYLDLRNLPAPVAGKQYQLWAIRGEEKISMGAFDLPKGKDEFVPVSFVENPDAFAVTLENAGGSPVPTLEEMYLLGAIEKPKPRRIIRSDNG